MITKIKEIACEFSDDVEKARVPAVLRSIAMRNGQHLNESISVQHHVQTRYDPYLLGGLLAPQTVRVSGTAETEYASGKPSV